MDLTPAEAERRSAAVEALVEEMRDGLEPNAWWDRTYDQLGQRTPTEALDDGDEDAVRELIAEWYRVSEASAERRRNDPQFMERIGNRSEALRHTA